MAGESYIGNQLVDANGNPIMGLVRGINGQLVKAGSALDPNAPSQANSPGGVPVNGPTSGATTAMAPTAAANPPPAPAYPTTTIGQSQDTPGLLGQGTFSATPYAINDSAITGNPNATDGNYGLNDVYNNLSQYVAQTTPQNYAINAPSMTAAQGTAASGQATTASAAQYQAALAAAQGYASAQGQASAYQGAQAAAQGYNATTGTSQGYTAAQSQAAQAAAAQYQASAAGQTGISTAGDTSQEQVQQGLENTLQTQANGGGVSPADLQLQQGEQNQIASQLAVLGSQRGGLNAGLAQNSAANQSAAAQVALNQNMGIQRAQETLSAQQALGTVANQNRTTSQNLNVQQANLNQGVTLANQGAQNAAAMTDAGMAQASNQYNASNLQQNSQANAAANNAASAFTAGAANTQTAENVAAMNAMGQFNAGAQNAQTIANQNAVNTANQYDATNTQNASFQNAANVNAANQFTAGAQNTAALQNATQFNAANQFDTGALNAQTIANQNAVNTQTAQNVAAAQQMGVANLGNAQQANALNLGMAGQIDQSNQATALAAQTQYYNQLLALSGAQTGIAQANRSASLANQTLQVSQQQGVNQTNEQAFAAAANNNMNIAGAIVGGISTLSVAGLNSLGALAKGTPGTTVDGIQYDQNGNAMNLPPPSSANGGGSGGDPTSGLSYSQGVTDAGGDPLSSGLPPEDTESQTLSDVNAKAGIQGGNPMLASFLDQLQKSQTEAAQTSQIAGDVGSGEAFRNASYEKQTTVHPGGGSNVGTQLIGAALGEIPFVGGLLGSLFGDANAAVNPSTSTTKEVQTSAGTGDTAMAPITDEDTDADSFASLSDDQAKENVISGNRGMQQFLQQAGAQQQSQGSMGATNNAFMQTGQAPSTVADRPTPPPPPGYGAQTPLSGVTPASYSPGGYAGAGASTMGGSSGQGMTAGGGLGAAGGLLGGGSYQGSGAPQGGGQTGQAGIYGGYTMAGNGLGATPGNNGVVSPGGVASMGGFQQPVNPVQQGFGYQLTQAPAGTAFPSGLTGANAVSPQMISQLRASQAPPAPPPVMAQAPAGTAFPSGLTGANAVSPSMLSELSDEDEKTNISNPDPRQLQGFLDSIHAHQYRYKDPETPGAGSGTFVSPMAQEIESTDLGKNFVATGPDGLKRVDYGKMAGTMLAGQAMLNEKVRTLEQFLSQSRGS